MRSRTAERSTRTRRRGGEGGSAPAASAHPDEDRARREGGPDDRALYGCACGAVFRADVKVDVPCPRCGAGQAW